MSCYIVYTVCGQVTLNRGGEAGPLGLGWPGCCNMGKRGGEGRPPFQPEKKFQKLPKIAPKKHKANISNPKRIKVKNMQKKKLTIRTAMIDSRPRCNHPFRSSKWIQARTNISCIRIVNSAIYR